MSMSKSPGLAPGVKRYVAKSWKRTLPLPGHYLAAPKGRKAYLVHAVHPRQKGGGYFMDAEPLPRTSMPEDAVVHWITWGRVR